ncbi:MAG TPA: electron transfer flavoprotein subunit beta [Verrucomicrobiales bacterium]|nr:electron transfer flavoprotein subunit beta [Verrucomicrobiales bacterium]
MKILVPIKRVPDSDTRIRVKPDGSGIVTDGVKFSLNPFDAIALEEALRIRERLGAAEVLAVTLGGEDSIEQLRTGLAMGADRALLVRTPGPLDSLAVARILAALVRKESPDLVLLGKQAIDDDSNQVGQMLGGMLGLPQATFVSKLEFQPDGRSVRCGRETDAGIETLGVRLPAVITADLRLNEPRYVSLPGIMKAKKRPIEELSPEALGVTAASRTRVLRLEAPAGRKAGVRLRTVEELVARLRDGAGLT